MAIQTHEADHILSLIQKWQKPHVWRLAEALSEHWAAPRDQSPLGDEDYSREAITYANQLADLQNDFAVIEAVVRACEPELLEFTPTVDLVCFRNTDVEHCIRLLKRLEGSLLAKLQPVAAPVTQEPGRTIPAAEGLPFGLQRCDVPQTLKRDGYKKAFTVKNDDAWKLMEASMAAYPNAVPESKLTHLFPYTAEQRKNARKILIPSINSLGLTVSKWVLTEAKT